MSLNDNITRYFAFDTSDDFADLTGTGSDATSVGSLFTASGKINGARDYNGTNNYVDTNYVFGTGDTSFTINFWAKTDDINTVQKCLAMTDVSFNIWFYIGFHSTLGWIFQSKDSNGVSGDGIVSNTRDTNMNMITLRRDAVANTLKLYVNNSIVQNITDTRTGNFSNTSWIIGRFGDTTQNYFNGIVDEVSFYTRNISDAEQTELYNSGSGLQYPYPVDSYSNKVNGVTPSKVDGVDVTNISKVNGI